MSVKRFTEYRLPTGNESDRLLPAREVSLKTLVPVITPSSSSKLQPVQLLPSHEIFHMRLSVPRANTSIRPSLQDTAAGSELIGSGAIRCHASHDAPVQEIVYSASSLPRANTSRRLGRIEATA